MTALLPSTTLTTAVSDALSAVHYYGRRHVTRAICLQAKFTYGSGGTSADAYVQTSLDGGTTWIDIANFHFTTASATFIKNLSSLTPETTNITPTDGSMAANTAQDGVIGDRFRVKYTTVGTYAGGTTLEVVAYTDQLQT